MGKWLSKLRGIFKIGGPELPEGSLSLGQKQMDTEDMDVIAPALEIFSCWVSALSKFPWKSR